MGLRLACVGLAIVRGALRRGGCDGPRVGRRFMSFKTAGQMRDGRAFGPLDFIPPCPTGRKSTIGRYAVNGKARAHNGPGITRQAGAKRTAQVARKCRCYTHLLLYSRFSRSAKSWSRPTARLFFFKHSNPIKSISRPSISTLSLTLWHDLNSTPVTLVSRSILLGG